MEKIILKEHGEKTDYFWIIQTYGKKDFMKGYLNFLLAFLEKCTLL